MAKPPDKEGLLLELGEIADTAGVRILSIKPLARANEIGITAGDVLQSVNELPVNSVSQFWLTQRRLSSGKPQLWRVQREQHQFFVAVQEGILRP